MNQLSQYYKREKLLIMNKWKRCKLGDVAIRVTSGGTPSTKQTEYYGGSIPWLNTKEIKNCRIRKTEKYITEQGLGNSSAKWIDENSVIVAMYGATAGKVAINKIPLTTNQACCNITIDYEKSDYNYLFYLLLNSFDKLDQMTSGAAQQNLNVGIISKLDIILPSLPEQRAIASVLSSLDDKIDLLHRQNKTLETMAETLFKQWFLEEAEEDWKVKNIGNVLQTVLGGTPSTSKPEYWDGNIPWINSGEVNNFRILQGTKYITEFGLQKSNTKLLPKGTTVLAITGATLGQVSLLEINTCANQSVVGVIPNENLPKEYVFLWMKHKIKEIILNETGGAQPHINKNDINETEIVIPDEKSMKRGIEIINPMFKKITKNSFQILTLEKLRDTLLPKLMSGEVWVQYDKETTI